MAKTTLFSTTTGDVTFPITPTTIDGMAIGGTTAAAGAFTTLLAGGAATLASADVTTTLTTVDLTSSGVTRRSTDSGVTAHAGGGRASAYAITKDVTEIATVGTAADSVVLPAALAGMQMIIINDGANAAQVFANGTDTIDGTAGATGVSQAAAAKVMYVAYASGLWVSFTSA